MWYCVVLKKGSGNTAKRRPNGDGMIRKRTDGRWEGRIVAGHKNNGKPIYREDGKILKSSRYHAPDLSFLKNKK